jgi:hypothetical protein
MRLSVERIIVAALARACDAVAVSSLPPGPAGSSTLQTAQWLLRPIALMESCRS